MSRCFPMKAMMVFGDDCCCFVLQFVSRWCLAMIVVVSCCNLFLVARSAFLVWLWHFVLIVSPVACVRFSFHVWHLLQFVSRCAYFTIELLCVSRLNLAFVALVFLLRAQRFSFRVSRKRFAFRVSCFRVSRFTLTFVICFSLRVFQDLISQWSGWEGNWTVTRFSSHSVAFVAFVFRVTCFAFLVLLWHLWQFFSRYAYVFLVSLWHLTMIRSCARWIFSKSCARRCARVQEPMSRKMVAVRDVAQDGVQGVMQDVSESGYGTSTLCMGMPV